MYHPATDNPEGDKMKSAGNRGATMLVAVVVLTLSAAGLNVVPAFADRHPGAVHQTNLSTNAGGTLAGKYKTRIKSPAEFKGTWVLTIAKGGIYSVANNGPNQVLIHGRYSATGSKITFGHETGNGACAKSGTYTWKKTARTLKFTRLSDSPSCTGRSGVLAHTFTQQR
jgi:hypothetical protein